MSSALVWLDVDVHGNMNVDFRGNGGRGNTTVDFIEIASGKTNVKNIAPHPAQKGIDKKSQIKSQVKSH